MMMMMMMISVYAGGGGVSSSSGMCGGNASFPAFGLAEGFAVLIIRLIFVGWCGLRGVALTEYHSIYVRTVRHGIRLWGAEK